MYFIVSITHVCSVSNFPQVGRLENAIGWYHSHPGYGCWLSGIDVSTQMLNQQFQEPFVAVVVRKGVEPSVISSPTLFFPSIL